MVTSEGPRIRDIDAYLADTGKLQVDTLCHTFEERELIIERATYGDGHGAVVEWPFHFGLTSTR